MPGLIDRLRDVRNRLVADPEFQALMARLPFTRPVARVKAAALFDLAAGFVYAQTALAFVQLDLPRRLSAAPMAVEQVAEVGELSPDAALRLLKAASALGLCELRGDGRWGLGEQGAALLGAPGVEAMIRHHPLLYADLADPLALLRKGGGGGALAGFWPYAEGEKPPDDAAAAYSELMAASQAMVARQVLDTYPVRRHRRVMDVGGGHGAFLRAVHARAPDLALSLFDLPEVARQAGAGLEADGIDVSVHGGNFFDEPLPPDADLISLIRILHDHDDGPVMRLLSRVRKALPAGGRLLIGEPFARDGGGKVGDAYFGFYLLAMGSGRARTRTELASMLREAGFRRSFRRPTHLPLVAGVIVAEA
jgi:demethylspheroidene O-methyltransferase